MRFIHVYLVSYFVLVIGAIAVLWQAGVLARIDGVWTAVGVIVALGLGIILAVASARPAISQQ